MPPRFDYEGSLQLAADLETIADEVATAHSHRAALRDVALEPGSFQGPYGTRHREFATAEDDRFGPMADACRDAASDWALAWQSAVDEYNEEVEQQARDDMRAYNDARIARWRLISWNDPENHYPYPAMGSVSPVRAAPLPAGPSYAADAAFAEYDFGPYDLSAVPTYRSAP